jgi:hypothetical protein
MQNHLERTVSLVAAVLLTGCAVSSEAQSAEPDAEGADLGTQTEEGRVFGVIPAKFPVFGRSITRWTEEWWHWLSEVPADRSPSLDLNADCATDQDDRVFFLPPFQAPSFQRRCTVRFGKPVLVGVQAVLNSYPCPDPTFEPAPGQTLEQFLREGAIAYNNLYFNIAATIDGNAVELASHRHTTRLFSNTVHPSLLSRIPDPCLTGAPQPAVSDGWYLATVMAPGKHQIRITASNPGGQPVERIYDVEIVR